MINILPLIGSGSNNTVLNLASPGFSIGNMTILEHVKCEDKPDGAPLASHCDWRFVDGIRPDKMGWANTNEIVFYTNNDTSARTQNLVYKNYRDTSGMLSGDYINNGGTNNWILPFAKFTNINNIIGARINNGQIEIVKRKNGVWSTVKTAPLAVGHFKVAITDSEIRVYVDGTLQASATHDIVGEGYFGISGHRWSIATQSVLSNYDVHELNRVVYNGEQIQYNGEDVYYVRTI